MSAGNGSKNESGTANLPFVTPIRGLRDVSRCVGRPVRIAKVERGDSLKQTL